MRVVTLVLLLAGASLALAAPLGAAHHCETKIAIYGRTALVPAPPPPYSTMTHGVCPRTGTAADHSLPPQTEQVAVRINGDLGVSIQTVRVTLHGLGFDGSSFTLTRTANPLGGFTYDMTEWVSLPGASSEGELRAVAYYPDGAMSTTYTLMVRASPSIG